MRLIPSPNASATSCRTACAACAPSGYYTRGGRLAAFERQVP